MSPRAAYVAPRDNVYVSLDWRQMELRLLAHFSADEKLVALFQAEQLEESKEPAKSEGPTSNDPFKMLACQWFKLTLPNVTVGFVARAVGCVCRLLVCVCVCMCACL